MNKPTMPKEDLILYLLSKIEPEQSTRIRLNKLAFFAEFGYIHKHQEELSDAQYAAINYGPVINNYRTILEKMASAKKITLEGNHIRPLVSPKTKISGEAKKTLDELIAKYSQLNNQELVGLSHATDSYKITTDNEKKMGQIIDKKLAYLETFFAANNQEEPLELPDINRADLVKYEF